MLETVQQTFVEVRDDLMEVVARKQKRERELHDQAAAAERAVEHLEAELARVTESLNGKVAEREKLEQIVSERLHGSDEFKRLSEQALTAETELERNEARVAEMKSRREEAASTAKPAIQYLYDAGCDTPRYQGEAHPADGWVARMIDFRARGVRFSARHARVDGAGGDAAPG
jgi:ABC-type transporter Mla subunit MlaD